ncbi:hypothetical protein [Campylobacter hyointestinalis]|uniref:hypothetical protein n=1 Tax=Campylobacter hyointestinalis TaxID=198 RepID=UPI001161AC9F|nr:hypothetical protein [Campylobacter hyointestinalis]
MRKIIFFLSFFTIVAFSNEFSQDEIKDRANFYQGCKAYPSWHYKSCQTPKQHIYQQVACKGFGICNW